MGAMSALTMDTHRIVKRLKDAGFTDSQAETLTDVIRETHASDWLMSRPGIGPAALAAQTDVAAPGTKFIKELVLLLLGQTVLIVALIKLLP